MLNFEPLVVKFCGKQISAVMINLKHFFFVRSCRSAPTRLKTRYTLHQTNLLARVIVFKS